jgi:hypothetical protein
VGEPKDREEAPPQDAEAQRREERARRRREQSHADEIPSGTFRIPRV